MLSSCPAFSPTGSCTVLEVFFCTSIPPCKATYCILYLKRSSVVQDGMPWFFSTLKHDLQVIIVIWGGRYFSKKCTVFVKGYFLCVQPHQFIKYAWFAWWVVKAADWSTWIPQVPGHRSPPGQAVASWWRYRPTWKGWHLLWCRWCQQDDFRLFS